MIDFIKSRDNEKIKGYTKLRDDSRERAVNNMFCAEGIKLCADLCVRLICVKAFFTEKAQPIVLEFLPQNCEKYLVDDNVAQKLSDVKTSQGLYCEFVLPSQKRENDEDFDDCKGNWVCLDNVQNPDNVGAILRSAVAFGYSGMALSPNCADVFSPKALRAGMGAVASIDIITKCDLTIFLQKFKANGGICYAACLENSISLDKVKPPSSVALVIGNEGKGITKDIIDICDYSVRIPISEKTESLNAAVAAGVLMWNFRGDN